MRVQASVAHKGSDSEYSRYAVFAVGDYPSGRNRLPYEHCRLAERPPRIGLAARLRGTERESSLRLVRLEVANQSRMPKIKP